MPVIAIFTKFDAMDDKAFADIIDTGGTLEVARAEAPTRAVAMFDRDIRAVLYGMNYPPKSHVLLRGELPLSI